MLIAAAIALAIGAFVGLQELKTPLTTGAVSPSPGLPVSASSPADAHTFAGHRYQFVPGALRWDEAKAKAEAMGGHLATVTSKEENEFIYATFGDKLDPTARASSIWIGGFADAMGQSFKWVTGEPFAFTDWSAGEPDYSGTSGHPMSGTFGVVIKYHAKLNWFDDPLKRDNSKAGFIVEWDDASPSSPASVDLIALADVTKDAEGGLWRREGTDLNVAEDAATAGSRGVRFGFALPVQVKGSYQIDVEFTKHGPRGTVSMFLPLMEDRGVEAYFQEFQPSAGLTRVRGYNTRQADNPTRVPSHLEDERRYRGALKVLLKGDQVDITAILEGKPLFRFQGPVKDLESLYLAPAGPTRPVLRSIDPVTWHSVRITPLEGGTLTPAREGVTLPAANP